MYAVLAQSWNFIGGLAGYPSFATAAFFGLGAYASAILQNHGVPMVPAWGCAGLAAMLFAALLGGAILHLRGHYFAIASLIVAEMLREIVNTHAGLHRRRHGPQPADPAAVGHRGRRSSSSTPCWRLRCCTAATAIVIHRSKLGFGLRCIQQNEDAANILGINTYAYKTAAFSLSAVFVGVAGAIYASWVNYIEPPDVFDVLIVGQADGDGAARRARHDVRPGDRRRHPAARSRRWSGAISSPSMPRRSASSSSCSSCSCRTACWR